MILYIAAWFSARIMRWFHLTPPHEVNPSAMHFAPSVAALMVRARSHALAGGCREVQIMHVRAAMSGLPSSVQSDRFMPVSEALRRALQAAARNADNSSAMTLDDLRFVLQEMEDNSV